MSTTAGTPEGDLILGRKAVERGWLSLMQLEEALTRTRTEPAKTLLDHLGLTRGQLEELHGTPPPARSIPPEVAAVAADPTRRIGRYVRMESLGQGGMGDVFRAWDTDLCRWVALKCLARFGDETSRAYFRREALLAASLDHPNIVKIYEVGEHEGTPFLAMQLVEGATLGERAKTLKLAEIVAVVRGTAEAIRHAHERKIIHRDLKPANVMVDRTLHAFVMDFGLAKEISVDGRSLGGSGAVMGTPQYMSPEQARGQADGQSDVYGIGAILYEAVTGRPPFVGRSVPEVMAQVLDSDPLWPRRLAPNLPQDVEAIILKAMERDRHRRYASAARLVEDLDAYERGEPLVYARRPTWSYVLGKKIRRRPLQWTFAAAMALAIAGGGTFGVAQLFRAKRAAEEKARVERESAARIDAERREVRRRLTQTYVLRGMQAEQVDANPAQALLWFASAVEIAGDDATAARLNRIRVRNWSEFFWKEGRVLATGGTRVLARSSWNENLYAIADEEGAVRMWDVSLGRATGKPMRHDKRITAAEFCRAFAKGELKSFLATAGEDGTLRRWDAATGEPIGTPLRHPDVVHALSWRTGTPVIATACADGIVRFWNGWEGELLGKSLECEGPARAVSFHPGGMRVATGSAVTTPPPDEDPPPRGRVRIWDFATRQAIGSMPLAEDAPATVRYLSDGQHLLVATGKHVSIAPDAGIPPTQWQGVDMDFGEEVGPTATSPGLRLLAVAEARQVHVANLRDLSTPIPRLAHPGRIAAVAFSPDERWILTAGDDRSLRIWSASTGLEALPAMTVAAPVNYVAFNTAGNEAVAFDVAGNLRVLRGREPEIVRMWDSPSELTLRTADNVSRDGRYALVGTAWRAEVQNMILVVTATEQVLDLATGRRVGDWAVKNCEGAWLCGAPNVLIRTGGQIQLWDVRSNRAAAPPIPLAGIAGNPSISQDGSVAAFSMEDRTVVFLDVLRGQRIGEPIRGRTGAELTPDGRRAFLGEAGGTLLLWDIREGREVGPRLTHPRDVGWVSSGRDGRSVLTACEDYCVRLWDTAAGRIRIPPLRHPAALKWARFSPDERWILTVCRDGSARVWDAGTGELLSAPISDPELTPVGWGPSGEILLADFVGLRRWYPLRPAEGDAKNLLLWAQATTRLSVDSALQVVPLTDDDIARVLRDLAGWTPE